MDSFKIVGYGKVRSDETSEYIIEVSPTATVKDVLADILNRKEWGAIGIKDDKEPFFGAHHFDYSYGEKEFKSHEEKMFWDKIMNRKVVALKGSGGWSCSDYQLVLGEV